MWNPYIYIYEQICKLHYNVQHVLVHNVDNLSKNFPVCETLTKYSDKGEGKKHQLIPRGGEKEA